MFSRLKFNHILIILLLISWGSTYWLYSEMQKDLNEERLAKKEAFLRQDTLKKVAQGWYQKYVADTATVKELRRLTDSLRIVAANPQGGGTIIIRPTDTITITDTIIVDEKYKQVEIVDYYPSKENYFLKYQNRFYLENVTTGTSKWEWKPINIDVIISEVDGKFKADFRIPDYINIDKVDIQARPLTILQKKDNFGYLLGGDWGKDFYTGGNYVSLGGGLRYKKIYLMGSLSTMNQGEIGFRYEF